MIAGYNCKQCKKITVDGYINEFNEHFCCEKCYKNYCEAHNYTINWNNLKKMYIKLNDMKH